jgi:hypothetical protein
MWYYEPERLFRNYYERKNKLLSFIKNNKWKIILGTLLLILIAGIGIFLNLSYLKWLINKFIKTTGFNTTISSLSLWRNLTIGFFFNLIVLLLYLYLFRKNKIKKKKYFLLFFFLLNLYLTIYLIDSELWNDIIRTLYAEFRFIVYLDVSLIILVPILFSLILKKTYRLKKARTYIKLKIIEIFRFTKKLSPSISIIFKKLYFQIKKIKKKWDKHFNLSKIIAVFLFLSLFLYCSFKAVQNYEKRYYHKYFEVFWFDEYTYATEFLDTITIGYETYMFDTNSPYSHMWPHIHTYLGDLRCIRFGEVKPYYNDFKYRGSSSDLEYSNFLNFVFNETKFINKMQANYENLPPYMRITKTVNYILIDSYSNPNLCRLMNNDTTHFDQVFQLRITNPIYIITSGNINLSVYIFRTRK